MFRSTQMRIEAELEQAEAQREYNQIVKEHYQNEKETKNRVDISLKELDELRKENEELKRQNSSYKNTLQTIFKPFMKSNDLSAQDVAQRLIDGEDFECELKVFQDFCDDPLFKKFAVIYKVMVR